jgi:hypothetical protein
MQIRLYEVNFASRHFLGVDVDLIGRDIVNYPVIAKGVLTNRSSYP